MQVKLFCFIILLVPVFTVCFGQTSEDSTGGANVYKSVKLVEARNKYTVKVTDPRGHIVLLTPGEKMITCCAGLRDGTPIRVEFTNIAEGLVPLPGESKVQFLRTPADISLRLYNPSMYIGENPKAAQVIYAQGSLKNDSIAAISSLVSYSAMEKDSNRYVGLAKAFQTGSIWGLAYDRQRKILFSSALAKRHSDLGSLGTGGIYMTDVTNNKTTPFISFDALGFPTGPVMADRKLSQEWGMADHDSLMFSMIGKIGLGGLDISDDSRFLYAVNLYDRCLYRIKLHADGSSPTVRDVKKYELPFKSFSGGNARPFAVKYHNGEVYLGVVCDAEHSRKEQDLWAYLYAIDADKNEPSSARFREVSKFALNYPRGTIDYNVKGWYPWTDNYLQTLVPGQTGWMIYPQPILADMEFDDDGSIIVSLMDRLGHQTGDGRFYRSGSTESLRGARGVSGGDVLRLSKQKKIYRPEENGEAGARISEGRENGEGPGGGEFYVSDGFFDAGIQWHQETASGGLAIISDTERLLVSVREPDRHSTGGVKWFSNQTGKATNGFSIFPGGMSPGYFWKSNNVGDIELITPLPDTEIGDRVWIDNNDNGLQDADEPVLTGIELQLYRGSELIGTTVSDQDGRYNFNNRNVLEGLTSRTDYEVRVAARQGNKTLTPTVARRGSIELDSDAVAHKDGYAAISLATGNPGENIHNLDFGFVCQDKPRTIARVMCSNNQLQVLLSDYEQEQRYDLTKSNYYEGVADYASAENIGQKGIIVESTLRENVPFEATLRVFAPSGCYQDQFVTSANQPGCNFIPENKRLETPYSVSIFPNPSTGPVHFIYRGNTSDGDIKVDIAAQDGRVIKTFTSKLQDGYHRQDLDLGSYTTGTYLLIVKEGSRQTTKSLVKN
ncbi:T9SS type A sorting domain-containing protein [Dyadobacter sp. CY261]|uniref:SdrD B-like domain-containing protein n=1 Tax=Dyadobacter sp. CY261 TaxID=2907203 RepID=UPI001F305EC4|nr:SdrD B-like domain-containing protein [Dyadobacter sp. CY261]MCF0075665.1 T9SS type A sorting domain-containing protein [Dyadobacter sp. CY261]